MLMHVASSAGLWGLHRVLLWSCAEERKHGTTAVRLVPCWRIAGHARSLAHGGC